MKPTKKQKILLDFIDGFTKGQGYSPTYREIMQALGYRSVSTVAKHIDNLVVRGWLVKREGEARSLEVVSVATACPKTKSEWWRELEKEIMRREGSEDPVAVEEVGILRQALAIVKAESK